MSVPRKEAWRYVVILHNKKYLPEEFLLIANISFLNREECSFSYLDMSVDQPVELEILIVITEGIDQLFSHFQESHVEEELEDGVDGDVEVNIERDTTTGHSRSVVLYLLPANDGEDEEEVGGEGDDLCVDHGDGDPVVAPQQPALGTELAKLLR